MDGPYFYRVVKYNKGSFQHLTTFFMSTSWGDYIKEILFHGGFLRADRTNFKHCYGKPYHLVVWLKCHIIEPNQKLYWLNLIFRNLQVTAKWSWIEAQIIAAVKIRAQVTLLKTESRESTTKQSPCMLVAPAKSFKTCKTTILEMTVKTKDKWWNLN